MDDSSKKPAGEYPMRINKYLAQQGYATRRGADELVERHKVSINGRIALLGDKVNEGDEVVVKKSRKPPAAYRYYAYNKPQGVITHSPQGAEVDIRAEVAHAKELAGTFPIGRLDKDSHGLIILTDDGRITDRLLNPVHAHEKEYLVKTRDDLREGFAKRLEAGVDIEGYQTKECKVEVRGDRSFSITLTEGKRHQIRRMVVAMKNEVVDLKRTRIMNITLSGIKPGAHRAIEGAELTTFLKSLGI